MKNLAFVQSYSVAKWEKEFLARVKNELSQPSPDASFQIVDQVERADLVLYSDTVSRKSTRKTLSACRDLLERVKATGGAIFALNFEDRPLGILPGIYSSLRPNNFDSTLHLSWPHLEAPNNEVETCNVETASAKRSGQEPFLFTFAGSCSHRLRRKIFSLYGSGAGSGGRWKVVEVDRWYNHTEDERKQYVQDILNSRFALCPRGIAAYSHRIFESILLERVPVIIGDDWVPFSVPDQGYYIRIAEKDIGQIAQILETELENYDDYLTNLRKLSLNWFGKRLRYRNVVEHFLKFHQQNRTAHDPAKLIKRLEGAEFRRANSLLSHQKIFKTTARVLRQLVGPRSFRCKVRTNAQANVD